MKNTKMEGNVKLIYGNLWENEARETKNPGPWEEWDTGKEVTIPCPHCLDERLPASCRR